eukprot:scaffold7115_cov125-Isochrysis_galbana.AAC.8
MAAAGGPAGSLAISRARRATALCATKASSSRVGTATSAAAAALRVVTPAGGSACSSPKISRGQQYSKHWEPSGFATPLEPSGWSGQAKAAVQLQSQ